MQTCCFFNDLSVSFLIVVDVNSEGEGASGSWLGW